MRRFDFLPTPIEGLLVIQRRRVEDDRGFLSRLYCQQEFAGAGVRKSISQINQTLTRRKGAVRGMHYQHPPHAEVKVVTCLRGEVFDVAIDVRGASPTFLHWHAEVLSAQNQKSLLIPEGFAHGFQALSGDCELVYLHTAPYVEGAEGALNARDPSLAIAWPLEIAELSDRDRNHAMLTPDFKGVDP